MIAKKVYNTIIHEGVSSIANKIRIRLAYKFKRFLNSNAQNKTEWEKVKGKYKGKRAFLIGNGPSLNKTKLFYLKNEYTLCFNRFNIMAERTNWLPSFYMITDNLVLDDMVKDLEEINEKVEYAFYPDIHFRGTNFKRRIKNESNVLWLEQKHGQGFSTSLPEAHLGGSVIYEGFQTLKHLGFDEIYFIGVDMNFKIHEEVESINGKQSDIVSKKDDDPNHFDPRYFGKNRKYHQPKDYIVQFIIKNLKYLSTVTEKNNLKIYNAGYDSKIDFFPRVDFEDLFAYSEAEKKDLLNECFRNNTSFKSVDDFKTAATFVESKDETGNSISDFFTSEDLGITLISSTIFTHLPLGPYDGLYFFVKRND